LSGQGDWPEAECTCDPKNDQPHYELRGDWPKTPAPVGVNFRAVAIEEGGELPKRPDFYNKMPPGTEYTVK